MNLVNSHLHPIDIPYDFYVLAAMDSLYSSKCVIPHDILLRWQEMFWQIQVPIVLLSNDPSYRIHQSYIDYVYCTDGSFYREFNLIRTKQVFGKTRTVIQAGLFVFDRGEAIKQMGRINEKSVAETYLFVLKIWYGKQVKKVKKKIDKGMTL